MGLDKGKDMFSETNWYRQTKAYGISVAKIGPVTWGRILKGAQGFSQTKSAVNSNAISVDDDERAMFSDME
jgi:hypothetical protein